MVSRRQAREWAVMMLCECDQNPPESLETALAEFWAQLEEIERDSADSSEYGVKLVFGKSDAKHVSSLSDMKAFAEERIRGVLRDVEAIDAELEPFLQHWSLYRLGGAQRPAAWGLGDFAQWRHPSADCDKRGRRSRKVLFGDAERKVCEWSA